MKTQNNNHAPSEPRLLQGSVRLRGIDPVAETAQRIITVMMARGALTSQASRVADGLGVDATTQRRVAAWLFETADALREQPPQPNPQADGRGSD